jgi:hypothetical protein
MSDDSVKQAAKNVKAASAKAVAATNSALFLNISILLTFQLILDFYF